MRYTPAQHDAFARDFNRDSLVILRNHIPRDKLQRWREAFQPLLDAGIEAERAAGREPVLCQLATDTPLKGSDYQIWHSDTPPLFPELDDNDTPSFQLAVNFPLCDVTDDNGPFETTFGTHR